MGYQVYPITITPEWLRKHPEVIFIFGDNLLGKGKKGSAICRDESNAWGFITKKEPNNNDSSFFRPRDYENVLIEEIYRLDKLIKQNSNKTILISKVGAGLANKYHIRSMIIVALDKFNDVKEYPNVIFLGGNT